MTELRIPLDPLNPGQFFACCGLFELCGWTQPSTKAWFAVDEAVPRHADFVLDSPQTMELSHILSILRGATYEMLPHADLSIQPVRISVEGRAMMLDWWLDVFGERTTPLKCWAGQVTTAKLFADLPALIKSATMPHDLFYSPVLTRSKLGIDPRSAWNALDFGFSPDKHNRDSATYPIVEVLGAIGLQGFRPDATRRDSVTYQLWRVPLPLAVGRLAAFSGWPGLPLMKYQFSIAKRGQSYKFFTFGSFVERR